jgi:hypothetical protein
MKSARTQYAEDMLDGLIEQAQRMLDDTGLALDVDTFLASVQDGTVNVLNYGGQVTDVV